ncbi:hypothetical protein GCM10022381_25880 [Leifsonia kafniensis]|uniref:Uncharacterized protein n=1 Tax=Leifsonia kafniensis TaxID=475957 RepID=A0ABP7KMV5_9MICO
MADEVHLIDAERVEELRQDQDEVVKPPQTLKLRRIPKAREIDSDHIVLLGELFVEWPPPTAESEPVKKKNRRALSLATIGDVDAAQVDPLDRDILN